MEYLNIDTMNMQKEYRIIKEEFSEEGRTKRLRQKVINFIFLNLEIKVKKK